MVVDDVRVVVTEGLGQCTGWLTHIGQLTRTGGVVERRKVLDRITDGGPVLHRCGPSRQSPIIACLENESLAMLRDSVAPCVKEPIVDNVSGAFEDVRDCPDDEEVVADRHVGDVLHENCPWFQCQDDIDEGSPQLLPGVDLIANAVVDETANLRPSSTAKRLTGDLRLRGQSQAGGGFR